MHVGGEEVAEFAIGQEVLEARERLVLRVWFGAHRQADTDRCRLVAQHAGVVGKGAWGASVYWAGKRANAPPIQVHGDVVGRAIGGRGRHGALPLPISVRYNRICNIGLSIEIRRL